jgi:UDP-glucose 4-epimerase
MRLLVTGGAGYIGSHCVTELLKQGHHVTVIDNFSTGFEESLRVPTQNTNLDALEVFREDVRHFEAVKKILIDQKIESVIHFAAKLIVPDSVLRPLEYYDNNVGGSLQLLRACKETGVQKFIFSSTATVYGNGKLSPLKEEDVVDAINPYGATKRMVEQMLEDEAKANPKFKFISLRYFNVAGAATDASNGQRSKDATHLIKVASQVALGQRDQMQIFGTDWPTPDKTCLRDYVHVQDLALAHIAALRALEQGHPGGIFNCGYGHGVSVLDVINTFSQILGKKFPAVPAARRDGDAISLIADSTRIQKELLWKPKFNSLELICRTAYEWEMKYSQGKSL